MRFLLTNDDGIEAEGISSLANAAKVHGSIRVFAPVGAYSGCSHRVTVDECIHLENRGPNQIAVHGTPADCVRLAIHESAGEFDWILSGINHGGNLGADVYYSGTVAAVREGALHGIPGIAFSQYRAKGRPFDWVRATQWVQPIIADLIQRPWQPLTLWNVNLPSLLPEDPDPQVLFCPLDPNPLSLKFRQDPPNYFRYEGDYFTRPQIKNHDIDICFNGQITITLLHLGEA